MLTVSADMFVHLASGRTFPTHAYFANPLGRGQLSLFNLLKAFSLLDEEVGYCQGLSFVAGVLLMHVSGIILLYIFWYFNNPFLFFIMILAVGVISYRVSQKKKVTLTPPSILSLY